LINFNTPQTTLAYIAGFFDGEGSIYISKGHSQYFLCAKLTNTNLPVLKNIERILNLGSTSTSHDKRERSSQLFRTQFFCNEAKQFLESIYPYLIIKKEQAKLAIEFQSKMKIIGHATISNQEKEHYKMMISSFNSKKGGFR